MVQRSQKVSTLNMCQNEGGWRTVFGWFNDKFIVLFAVRQEILISELLNQRAPIFKSRKQTGNLNLSGGRFFFRGCIVEKC